MSALRLISSRARPSTTQKADPRSTPNLFEHKLGHTTIIYLVALLSKRIPQGHLLFIGNTVDQILFTQRDNVLGPRSINKILSFFLALVREKSSSFPQQYWATQIHRSKSSIQLTPISCPDRPIMIWQERKSAPPQECTRWQRPPSLPVCLTIGTTSLQTFPQE